MLKPCMQSSGSVNRQSGFTLAEMAIVLVIIGLLVAGIMQGQSLMRAAKVRDMLATATDLSSAANSFKERYRVLPGDHPTATAEIQGATANGNGDGLISVAESANVPNHLISAGLIKGGAGNIRTGYGFAWIVQRTTAMAGGSPCGVAVNSTAPVPAVNNMIVFSNLPGDVAMEIDTKLDDGLFNAGSVRASAAYTNTTVQCLALPLQ